MIYINDEPVIIFDPTDESSISKDIEDSDSVTEEESGTETPLC